jgi:hypothetical protein
VGLPLPTEGEERGHYVRTVGVRSQWFKVTFFGLDRT